MRWLVTIKKTTDLDKVMDVIRRCGGEPDQDQPPVPLEDAEWVIQVNGSASLDTKLKSIDDIIAVYPDSEMTLY